MKMQPQKNVTMLGGLLQYVRSFHDSLNTCAVCRCLDMYGDKGALYVCTSLCYIFHESCYPIGTILKPSFPDGSVRFTLPADGALMRHIPRGCTV